MNKIILLVCLIAFAPGFVTAADERATLNSSYKESQVSADVQGLGNRIIDQANKSKYLKFNLQKTEYAYVIERVAQNEITYTGNEVDLKGMVFLQVRAYKDGFELPKQLSSYRPSKYDNSIRIVKMDRNENRPYEFDIGIDGEDRLYIVENANSFVSLEQVDVIKKYVPRRERKSDYAF